MAKVETKQEQAPAAAEGEAKQEASVKVRILKTGTEIDGSVSYTHLTLPTNSRV